MIASLLDPLLLPGLVLVLVVAACCAVVIGVYRAQRKHLWVAVLVATPVVVFIVVRFVVKWVIVGLLALVAGVAYWRRGHGRRAASAWLGARRDWKHIRDAHDLTGGAIIAARPTEVGRLLTVRLPRGATIDTLTSGTTASATTANAATIRRGPIPRVVHIAIRDGADPLRHPVHPAPLAWECPDLEALTLGMCDDGQPWRQALRGKHVFIAGETGSGKGGVVWGIVTQLAPGVATGHVRIVAIDPKGGMELAMGRSLFNGFATQYGEMLKLLRFCVKVMDERSERLAGKTRLHTPTPDDPLIVVLIDELATLTAYHPDQGIRQAFANVISLLLSKGRAVGVVVVGAVQDPRKEIVPMRALFSTRVALRLVEAIQVPMVLGDGARERGAEADMIDPELPGVGFVIEEGTRDPLRVRAAHVTDDHIKAACLHVDLMRARVDTFGVCAPTLTPPPAPAPAYARHTPQDKPPGRTPKVTRAERRAANRAAWAARRRDRKEEES